MAKRKKVGQRERPFRPVIGIYQALHTAHEIVLQEWLAQVDHTIQYTVKQQEARVKAKTDWMIQHMEAAMKDGAVHIYVVPEGADPAPVSKTVAQKLTSIFLLYNHNTCFNTHRYFDNGTSSTVYIWMVQRNSMIDGVARRQPYVHTDLTSYLSCSVSDADIYQLARYRFEERNVKPGTWAFHLGSSARAIIISIPIHIINYVMYAIANLHERGADPNADESAQPFYDAILDMVTVEDLHEDNSRTTHVRYTNQAQHEETVQKIWVELIKKYKDYVETVVENCMVAVDASRIEKAKSGGSTRKLLREGELLTPYDVLLQMFAKNDIGARLGSFLLEALYSGATQTQTVSARALLTSDLTTTQRKTMRVVHRNLLQGVLHCVDDLTAGQRRNLRNSINGALTVAHDDFLGRREAMAQSAFPSVPPQMPAGPLTRQQILDMLPPPKNHPAPSQSLTTFRPPVRPAAGPQQNRPLPANAVEDTSGAENVCYLCEQVWPEKKQWPPVPVRVKDGMRVTVEQAEQSGAAVATRTRARAGPAPTGNESGAVHETGTNAHPTDMLDTLDKGPGRTDERRVAALREVIQDVLARTSDLPNAMDVIHGMIDTAADARDNEEVERAEREAARVEAAQRKEALKAALTVSKTQKRHDRAEVRALRVANDQQRDRAAIQSRTHEGPAENVTNDNMAAAQHAVREQPHRPPTPPDDLPPPPRLSPVVEPPIGPIPPPPSALDAQQVARCHTWVPQQWGTTDLGSMTTLMAGITN